MKKVRMVAVLGSGFEKDRPVNSVFEEILDIWGKKRFEAGVEAIKKGVGDTLVFTGGLPNSITNRTVAEVCYLRACDLRIFSHDIRVAGNVSRFEVSARGDIQQALSTVRPDEEICQLVLVTELPHYERVRRIAEQEMLNIHKMFEIKFLASGAPTPWWYGAKEKILNGVIRRFGEQSVPYRFLDWLWDFIKPIFLNMPRKNYLNKKLLKNVK